MENLTITVFIPNEDFTLFLEYFKVIQSLPNLEADYTFRGKDIKVFEEKMSFISCKQINIPILDYLKWQYYHNKNSQ